MPVHTGKVIGVLSECSTEREYRRPWTFMQRLGGVDNLNLVHVVVRGIVLHVLESLLHVLQEEYGFEP